MTRAFDFAIIGNGIIGLSLAEEVLRRDPAAAVAIIGPSSRPGAASRAAGAMLGCFGEVTKDTLASAPARAKFNLSVDAHRRWPARLSELESLANAAGEHLHRVAGTFVILNARSGNLDTLNFAAMLDAIAAWEEPWEEVDPSDIAGVNPVPVARPLRAVHLPQEGALDAHQVLRLLEDKVAVAGATLIDAQATALRVKASGITGVTLEDGEAVDAQTVAVAAGASSARLLRTVLPIERVLPMYSGLGVSLVARRVCGDPFTAVVRTPNRAGACGLHVVPLDGDREYFGATNVLFADPEPQAYVGVGHLLVGTAMEQLDRQLYFHRVEEWRMGTRPVTLDGFPVVGWTDIDGLYVVSGTYRDGFHCSPVLADHAADELLGGRGTAHLPFPPHRAPLAVRSVDEAIAEFVLHSVSSWFEFDAALPPFAMTDELGGMFEFRAREFHELLGLKVGLAPELLMFLLEVTTDPASVNELGAYLTHVT